MRIRIVSLTLVAVVVVCAATLTADDPVGASRLQQAIDLIESKGDPSKAMPLLEDAAKSTDRAIAARALLYVADAQARSDRARARATLQRIVETYPEQSAVVSAARMRLSAIQVPDSTLTDRLVWPTQLSRFPSSVVTRDGRLLLFPDRETGAPAIRELASGRITYLASGPEADAIAPRLSPDGTQVAYQWAGVVDGRVRQEIRVIEAKAGSLPRTIWPTAEGTSDFREVIPREWSADGKSLLVDMNRRDDTWQFAWLSVADARVTVIRSTDWTRPDDPGQRRPSLSPDGRYLAYAALARNPNRPEAPAREAADERIYILAVDGSSQTELTQTGGVNRQPVWTADGAHILFLSGRTGTVDLWAAPVEQGRPSGDPVLVKREIGFVTPIGATSGGAIYYVKPIENPVSEVSFVELPGGVPRAAAPAGRVEPFFGDSPVWAPDGRSVAVRRMRPDGTFSLVVHALANGREVTFAPASGDIIMDKVWFHDGTSLLVMVRHDRETTAAGASYQVRSLYRADLTTGAMTEVGSIGRFVGRGGFTMHLSPDDRTLYVTGAFEEGAPMQPPFRRITAVSLADGRRSVALEMPAGQAIGATSLRPDGKAVAVAALNPAAPNLSSMPLMMYDLASGSWTEIGTLSSGGLVGWNAEPSRIFMSKRSRPRQLLATPVTGGAPVKVLDLADGVNNVRVSPDGSHVAIETAGAPFELRAIENVASVLKTNRR